jgi:hypothetical protein
MRNLQDFLKRFTNSLNKDAIARQAVRDAVLAAARVNLRLEDISLKEGVLTLAGSAAAKNEMRLKEERILSVLRELHNIRVLRVMYI